VTEEQARDDVIRYWLSQARDALASAQAELAAGRPNFAVNRVYYACFYSASAALLKQGRTYVKHRALRAAVHRELVKSGRLDAEWGRFYDLASSRRAQADYAELVTLDQVQVAEMTQKAAEFVSEMERILAHAT
jgi:uncharacterized protein (UPF0332 family)